MTAFDETGFDETGFDETAAYIAVTRLQAAYGDVVTRRAWDELVALFEDGAPIHVDTVTRPVIELTGAAELGRFIGDAIARFEFFEFVILNAVVAFRGPDDADGRVYIVELRQEGDGGPWSNAFGVYHDRYRRDGGRWRFAERSYRSLARTGEGDRASVFPFPGWPA